MPLLDTCLSTCQGPAHEGRCRGPRVKHEPDVIQHVPEQRKSGHSRGSPDTATRRPPGSERPWAGPISQKRLLELNSELLSCSRPDRRSLQRVTAGRAQTRELGEPAQLPSHLCLGPNPDASGQALRTPASPVSVPVLPRKQIRVFLNHPCYISQMEKHKAFSPRRRPQVLPPWSSPSPQQQEAPVGQETRAQLLGGLGWGCRDESPAFSGHGTWVSSTHRGRPGTGAYMLGPGGEPPPPGAVPGSPCASPWPEVDMDCSSMCAAAQEGPALTQTQHRG